MIKCLDRWKLGPCLPMLGCGLWFPTAPPRRTWSFCLKCSKIFVYSLSNIPPNLVLFIIIYYVLIFLIIACSCCRDCQISAYQRILMIISAKVLLRHVLDPQPSIMVGSCFYAYLYLLSKFYLNILPIGIGRLYISLFWWTVSQFAHCCCQILYRTSSFMQARRPSGSIILMDWLPP